MLTYRAADLLDPSENITVQRCETSAPEPPHTHDFIELVYIAGGSGIQRVGDREYAVRRGCLLFLNCGERHAFVPEGRLLYYNILLRPEFMGQELVEQSDAFSLLSLTAFEEFRGAMREEGGFTAFEGEQLRELEAVVGMMHREFSAKEPGYRTVLRGCLSVLLARLFRQMAIPETGAEKRHGLPPAIFDYIEAHCCERLTLPELASRCFYNPSYFSRVFKETSGMSLTDYIGQKRMERAAELLRETALSVEKVAQAVGYREKGQFYRQFKAFAGATPRAYRESARAETGPDLRKG